MKEEMRVKRIGQKKTAREISRGGKNKRMGKRWGKTEREGIKLICLGLATLSSEATASLLRSRSSE